MSGVCHHTLDEFEIRPARGLVCPLINPERVNDLPELVMHVGHDQSLNSSTSYQLPTAGRCTAAVLKGCVSR
jgi:hypothetical protein